MNKFLFLLILHIGAAVSLLIQKDSPFDGTSILTSSLFDTVSSTSSNKGGRHRRNEQCKENPYYLKSLQNACDSNSQMNQQAPDAFAFLIPTQYGDITANCKRNYAPAWIDRIFNLALNGYYNNNYFMRVQPGFVVQWGTGGNPRTSRVYDFSNPAAAKNCGIIQPQPPFLDFNINGITPLSNTFGTISFSTSANETYDPALTWNATAELFFNVGDNKGLDANLFVPFCTVNNKSMNVVLKFPSFGELSDLGGPGPSLAQLYAQGNKYIKSNKSYNSMAQTGKVRVAPVDFNEHDFAEVCGPCVGENNLGGKAYADFDKHTNKWRCPKATTDAFED